MGFSQFLSSNSNLILDQTEKPFSSFSCNSKFPKHITTSIPINFSNFPHGPTSRREENSTIHDHKVREKVEKLTKIKLAPKTTWKSLELVKN